MSGKIHYDDRQAKAGDGVELTVALERGKIIVPIGTRGVLDANPISDIWCVNFAWHGGEKPRKITAFVLSTKVKVISRQGELPLKGFGNE